MPVQGADAQCVGMETHMRTHPDPMAAAKADLLPVADQVRGAYARLRMAETASARTKHVHWRHVTSVLGGRFARAQSRAVAHTHTHPHTRPVPTV